MTVYNVKGTAERACSCGSWKNHWVKVSKKEWPVFCSESACLNEAEVGAHVCIERGGQTYIIPLCHEHNMVDGPIDILEDTVMVSANVSETCGRSKEPTDLEKALLKFLSEGKGL